MRTSRLVRKKKERKTAPKPRGLNRLRVVKFYTFVRHLSNLPNVLI